MKSIFCLLTVAFLTGCISINTPIPQDQLVILPKVETIPNPMGPFRPESMQLISDLDASDIYLNLRVRGYTMKPVHHSPSYTRWELERGKQICTIYGRDTNVSWVRMSCFFTPGDIGSFSALGDLPLLATLEYENSDPDAARDWVKDNINRLGAHTIIGDVAFVIDGGDLHRDLYILHKSSLETPQN